MSQSLARNLVHLVFGTKHRAKLLSDAFRPDLHRYMAGILESVDCPAVIINSVPDHVHALFHLHRRRALASVVGELKRGSSRWLKEADLSLATFHWQNGYAAFSVSHSAVPTVKAYISSQAEHHRRKSFEDEFRSFLIRHEIPYDERFLWD
ncbi:MAG: IS200/IS605 family transposase [Verrucomicrobiales bacterium]|nr:IS200/IS605 family transposase [Verrucomicrobiales bacterium]